MPPPVSAILKRERVEGGRSQVEFYLICALTQRASLAPVQLLVWVRLPKLGSF